MQVLINMVHNGRGINNTIRDNSILDFRQTSFRRLLLRPRNAPILASPSCQDFLHQVMKSINNNYYYC